MKIFMFLAFMLIAERATASLDTLRKRTGFDVNDVARTIEELSDDFDEMIFKNAYQEHAAKISFLLLRDNGKLSDSLDVHEGLRELNEVFFKQCYAYIAQHAKEYVRLASEMSELDDVDQKRTLASVGFLEKHDDDYCLFAALYGRHTAAVDGDLLLETWAFFQTVDPDDQSSRSSLTAKLQWFSGRYEIAIKHIKSLQRFPPQPPPGKSVKVYRDAMTVVEKKITAFSRRFCPIWRPNVVGPDIIRGAETRRLIDDDQNRPSPFVRYIRKFETCTIVFWRKDYMSLFTKKVKGKNDFGPDVIEIENQRNRIHSWDCNGILKSPEYRYENYRGDYKQLRRPSPPVYPSIPTDDSMVEDYELSLDALKYGLKSNSYHMNFMKYYNIMADVVLLVSIKEGDKVLNGIKLVVNKRCKNREVNITVDRMRGLRSTLSEFKSVYDGLVSLILDKKLITVSVDGEMKSFKDRIDSVLLAMDVRNDLEMATEKINGICDEIPQVLAGLRNDVYIGDTPTTFYSYYFTQPILNINELYSFSANDF